MNTQKSIWLIQVHFPQKSNLLFTLNVLIQILRMKSYFTFLLIFIFSSANAQFYNSHFQLDAAGTYAPFIHSSAAMPNGNIAYTMSLYDSTSFNPGNLNFYAPNTPNNSGTGIIVVRPNKTIAWSHTWHPLTDSFGERITSYKILSDANGNIYLAGSYQGKQDLDPSAATYLCNPNAWNHHNSFIIKLDVNGNFLWAKKFESANAQFVIANITDANILVNGNICFVGDFNGSIDFDPGPGVQILNTIDNIAKPFMLTLDPVGNFVSVRTNDVGSSTNTHSHINAYKINSLGESYILYRVSDTLDVDFGANTVLYTSPTPFALAKYDASMQLIWSKALHQNMELVNIDTSSGTDLFVFGQFVISTTLSNNTIVTSTGGDDIFYEKWDSAGNCLWAKTMGSTFNDYISSAKEYGGYLYLLNSYRGSLNTNTGSNDTTIISMGGTDVALSKLDLNGHHISTTDIKSNTDVWIQRNSLTLENGLLNLNIRPYLTADVAPGAAYVPVFPLWSVQRTVCIVQWGDNNPVGINDTKKNNQLAIYPNPASDVLNIQLETNERLIISTFLGQQLKVVQGEIGLNKINLKSLQNGTYIISGDRTVGSVKFSVLR